MTIGKIGTLLTLLSVIFFPWPLSVLLAVGMSALEPLVPLAVGLFADALYYVPHGSFVPLYTLGGALVTASAYIVRSRLKASIIQ